MPGWLPQVAGWWASNSNPFWRRPDRKTWPRRISPLQIEPVTVELAPNRIISTIGYNGTSPGPLLRMKEGVPVTVNVINKTDVPEFVHFHGLLIPSDVDGSEEEGTPAVPPHGSRRYQFTRMFLEA